MNRPDRVLGNIRPSKKGPIRDRRLATLAFEERHAGRAATVRILRCLCDLGMVAAAAATHGRPTVWFTPARCRCWLVWHHGHALPCCKLPASTRGGCRTILDWALSFALPSDMPACMFAASHTHAHAQIPGSAYCEGRTADQARSHLAIYCIYRDCIVPPWMVSALAPRIQGMTTLNGPSNPFLRTHPDTVTSFVPPALQSDFDARTILSTHHMPGRSSLFFNWSAVCP